MAPPKKVYGKQVLHDELIHTLSKSSLPMLLRYVDRNSMAHSIESRVPFLTTDLVEFIFSLPEHYLIAKDGLSKAIFRSAMHGIMPQKILERRDKIGFATPEKNWLLQMSSWVETILKSDAARSIPVFNHGLMIRQWQEMLAGKRRFDLRYWRWLNFIIWSQRHSVVF